MRFANIYFLSFRTLVKESKLFIFVKFSFLKDHASCDILKKFFTNPKITKISSYVFI